MTLALAAGDHGRTAISALDSRVKWDNEPQHLFVLLLLLVLGF